MKFNEIGDPEITVNEDELVGYIIRNASEIEGNRLDYDDVALVLRLELDFLKQKGIANLAER